MNGQVVELWGRWLTEALRGQNQVDVISRWWLRGWQEWSPLGRSYGMLLGIPAFSRSEASAFDVWQQVWDGLFKMHQLLLQWTQVVPQHKYDQLSKRAEELEGKLRDQAKTIDRLRRLLSETGDENNVVVAQLQDLIGQQSQQFKQMTQSVTDYIKSSTQKVSQKK